jgi:hypothetical protein
MEVTRLLRTTDASGMASQPSGKAISVVLPDRCGAGRGKPSAIGIDFIPLSGTRIVKKTDGPQLHSICSVESEINRSFGRHGVAETGGTRGDRVGRDASIADKDMGPSHWLLRLKSAAKKTNHVRLLRGNSTAAVRPVARGTRFRRSSGLPLPPVRSGGCSSPDDCAPHESGGRILVRLSAELPR